MPVGLIKGESSIKELNKREGLVLYWCEGDKSKSGKYKVAVTSSDPRMIKHFISWIYRYYGVNEEKIKLRLHLWPESKIDNCQNWWLKKLNYEFNFTKPYIKEKSGKNNKYPNGICRASLNSKEIFTRIIEDISLELTS